jgi:hypothetical protein
MASSLFSFHDLTLRWVLRSPIETAERLGQPPYCRGLGWPIPAALLLRQYGGAVTSHSR